MKPIPALFFLGPDGLATEAVTPSCEWVLAGEGVSTRMWDGLPVLVKDGKAFAWGSFAEGSGAWVAISAAVHPHHSAAYDHALAHYHPAPPDGTYELVGPGINGNPEGYPRHTLIPHHHIQYPLSIEHTDEAELRRIQESETWRHGKPEIQRLLVEGCDGPEHEEDVRKLQEFQNASEDCKRWMIQGVRRWVETVDVPRDYEGIKAFLAAQHLKGVVWWRKIGEPEAGLAKARRSDFGIPPR